MAKFLLIFIPALLLIVWWVTSIHYIAEGKWRKELEAFDSDDGISFFGCILFVFVLFPFIIRPLMVLKSVYKYITREFGLKWFVNTLSWCWRSFINTFIVPAKVGWRLLKK